MLRALYRAACNVGIANQVSECITGDTSQEDDFVINARRKLASEIRGRPSAYVNQFNNLQLVDQASRKEIIQSSLPDWMGSALEQCASGHGFADKCAECVSKSGAWLGEMELDMLKRMLAQNCVANVRTHCVTSSHDAKDLACGYMLPTSHSPTLILVNMGDTHYTYISQALPPRCATLTPIEEDMVANETYAWHCNESGLNLTRAAQQRVTHRSTRKLPAPSYGGGSVPNIALIGIGGAALGLGIVAISELRRLR